MSCRYFSHYELVNYAHIMTSFKYLRVSIVPLKVSCIVFSIASIILWYIFSCKCFNWVTWRMLAPCYDYSLVTLSLYDHLVFDLLYHFMLVAMHDYDRYALLVGGIPVFLLASTCTEYVLYSYIQPPKAKFFQSVSTISTYLWYFIATPCDLFMCYL